MKRCIARLLSAALNPYVHPIHVFAYMTLTNLITIRDTMLGIALYSLIPLSIHIAIVVLTHESYHIPSRELRIPILVAALIGYILSMLLIKNHYVYTLALMYIASSLALLTLIVLTRVSAHVMAFAPVITFYAYLNAIPIAIALAIALLLVAWSRAKLEVHDALQISLAIAAGFSASTTVLLVH